MRTLTSRRVILSAILVLGITAFTLYSGPSQTATGDEANASEGVVINPFHGTYQGGFWGKVSSTIPYGGDITAKVSQAGVVTVTLPGAGTGTVSPTGAYTVLGTLVVSGVSVNVSYTGNLVATKNPATGAFLSVVGVGTWRTTSGVTASGKWLVRRTLTTP